jgi:hypothetical protein
LLRFQLPRWLLWTGAGLIVAGLCIWLAAGFFSPGKAQQPVTPSAKVADLSKTLQQVSTGQNPVQDQYAAANAEAERWVKSYIERTDAAPYALDRAAERYDVTNMLTPQTWADPARIAASKQNVAGLRTEIQRIQADLYKLMDNAPAEVLGLNVPDEYKKGLTYSLHQAAPEARARLDKFFAVELEFTTQAVGLLEFMERLSPGGYRVNGMQIMFTRQSDVDQYNRFLAALDDLIKQEIETKQTVASYLGEEETRLLNSIK